MTKRAQKFVKVLFASMLLTLTVALGGCSGDKEAEDSTQIADTAGLPQNAVKQMLKHNFHQKQQTRQRMMQHHISQ